MRKKAIVLLSGGLDSTTCLAQAKADGFDCYTLGFCYGQKHHYEIENAKHIASKYGVIQHQIIDVPLQMWGGSALNDPSLEVKDYDGAENIPTTYVPARNTIFLSLALSYAEVIGANDIYIGINAVDYSHYPDCRPEYLRAFEAMANLATKAGVEGRNLNIHAPLLLLSKAEIIKKGIALNVDYAETVTCYRADNDGNACGRCDACTFRRKGFVEAGVADPTRYVKSVFIKE